jgi:hypothetical protein
MKEAHEEGRQAMSVARPEESIIEVDLEDSLVAFMIEDGSVEKLDDGTYRMTEKGAAWLHEWIRHRLADAKSRKDAQS